MFARIQIVILIVSIGCLIQACAKPKKFVEEPPQQEEGPVGGAYVTAGNPNAILSDVLQKLKGRWVTENPDPLMPDPATMRLHATANHTLEGRLLVTGGFSDVGVKAILKQNGEDYTLTLIDDEIRPHDNFPKEREFTGKYDAEAKELSLKTTDGEFIKWELPGGFKTYFSASLFKCTLVPTPSSSAAPGIPTVPARPTIPTTPTTPAPPVPAYHPTRGGSRIRHLVQIDQPLDGLMAMSVVNVMRPVPNPTATAVPVARLNSCGVTSTNRELWNRMSGSD